jgi:hypothetical protein
LAVIAHGLSRATKDADVWLDPLSSADEWAAVLNGMVNGFPRVSIARLPHWTPLVSREEIAAAVRETGMVRVFGLECPLDIFRAPNEVGMEEFEGMWSRSIWREDGAHLLDPIDLLLTKEDTGRDRDFADQRFLESKIRSDYRTRLSGATLAEARALFARYTDHVVCEAALTNPDPAVQALGRETLRELAAQGDWFSREILARLEEPDPPADP